MKKGFVILMSVLMAFLLGCEKDEFLIPQDEAAAAAEFRDVPTVPQTPAWKVVIFEIDGYIMSMVKEGVVDTWVGKSLMKQSNLIEKLATKGNFSDAKEQVRVFEGKVEVMAEKGYVPADKATPLLKMTEELWYIFDGKRVQFREGFEDYETGAFPYEGGWQLKFKGMGDNYQGICNRVALSGRNSLKLEGRPGWAAVAYKPVTKLSRVIFAEANVYIQNPLRRVMDYPRAGFGIGNPEEGMMGTNYAFVTFDADRYIYFGPTQKTIRLQKWQFEKWYKLTIRYDDSLEKGSLWIDGELVVKDFNLRKSQEGTYSGIILNSGKNSHTYTYFDDVMVWTPVE